MANLTRYTHQTTRAAELVRLPCISARDLDPETKLFKKTRPDPGIWPTDGFRKSGLVWSIPESDHPLILPTVGQNPPGTPLILFAGPGYIEVSKGEPAILHLDPIS